MAYIIPRKKPGKSALALICLLILAGIFAILELTNTTHVFHKEPLVASGVAFNTKGEKASSSNSSKKNDHSFGSSSSNKSDSAAILFTPTGTFVSNHHPNLSGSPAPNTIASVCNTTPGANCKLVFTNGDTTKELSAQTADANGSVYWNWKLQDIRLTSGTWKVQAVASLGGQTKKASDAMDLVVAQ